MNAERRPWKGGAGAEAIDMLMIAPLRANQAALRRRLQKVARDEEALGHHAEAAIARWLLAGAA